VTRPAFPVPLAPPLRPFRKGDAQVVAELNDAASGGLMRQLWQGIAGPGGDAWKTGRQHQLKRAKSGQAIVVADAGQGPEAVLIGMGLPPEPENPFAVPPVFAPLVELENLARGAWYLNVIGTVPQARRRGHARRLMGVAEALARAGGHGEIALTVHDANAPALALYRAAGFSERARRPVLRAAGWAAPGRDWLLMVRPLD
jgi:ribosomal protein S18 acetylase RimI-like enzyme